MLAAVCKPTKGSVGEGDKTVSCIKKPDKVKKPY